MERKKSVEAWAPVYLVGDTDGKTPETGKTYSDVTVKYAKEGATSFTTKSMASGDWQEIGDGFYRVKFSSTELNTAGNYEYEVYATGTRKFPGHIDVVENLEKDTYDIVSHATYGNSAIKSAVDTKAAPADILQDPATDKIDGSQLDKAISALNDVSAADVWSYDTRSLTAGGDASQAKQDQILTHLDEIKEKSGGSFDRDTDSLEAIRDRGDAEWATGGVGEGSVTVNHNTGGTDNLRYVTSAGAGIEDAYVRAYLKADYDAGNRGPAFVKATVRTGPDGRWVQDMKLDPATYVFEFVKQGAYGPDTKEVTVT